MPSENLTTTTQVDSAVGVFYDRVLLKRALPYLIHELGAQERPIEKKTGNTAKFRRYTALTVATTPLTEGVTPAGKQLAKTDLTVAVSQYGDFTHITDVVDMTVEDSVLTEASELLGEQMGQTRDVLVRDILAACASSTNSSGGANGNTPTELTKASIDVVVKTLLGGNAKFYTQLIKAGSGQGTMPIRPAFIAKCHTDLIDDLEDISGFKPTAEYSAQDGVMEAEWGSTGNVRWLHSTQGYKSTATPAVYSCLIHGRDAFGVVELSGGTARNIVKGFGSGGTADPLNQRATSGWKMMFAARILNDAFIHNIKATHS